MTPPEPRRMVLVACVRAALRISGAGEPRPWMVSRTAAAWGASPVTGDRSRAERIIGRRSCVQRSGARPCSLVEELPGVRAIEWPDAHLRPIQLHDAGVD